LLHCGTKPINGGKDVESQLQRQSAAPTRRPELLMFPNPLSNRAVRNLELNFALRDSTYIQS
jgi:hypothetical protein